MADRRVFQMVDDRARLRRRVDMRHDDAEGAAVEGARRHRHLHRRHADDRRDAGVERRDRDLRGGVERHRAMLEVEEDPVIAARLEDLGNIDAAAEANAEADRQFAALQALACRVADGVHGSPRGLPFWRGGEPSKLTGWGQ